MIWMQGIYSDERQLLADLDAMDLFALALPCWKRRPTWAEWDEVCGIRAIGDPMAMLLPPKSQWVNIHNNCFHLHEIEGE